MRAFTAGPFAAGVLTLLAVSAAGVFCSDTSLHAQETAQTAVPEVVNAPQIPFESEANLLKLPPDMNMGEAAHATVGCETPSTVDRVN